MKSNFFGLSAKTGVVLLALGFSVSAWAECISPLPAFPAASGLELGENDYFLALAGGNVEGCPGENLTQLCSDKYPDGFPDGKGECTYFEGDVEVRVTSTAGDGEAAFWKIECFSYNEQGEPELMEFCPRVPLVDVATTSNARGGNACLYSFGVDVREAYAGDPGLIRYLYLCSDGTYEVPGVVREPETVSGCELTNGQSVNIYGVQVSCSVEPGEQRTIVVANDDLDDFGFLDQSTGQIDFNNICICRGDEVAATSSVVLRETGEEVPVEEECDPNPSVSTDPSLLEPCTVGEDANPVTEVQFQNPRCVTVGGTRRCY